MTVRFNIIREVARTRLIKLLRSEPGNDQREEKITSAVSAFLRAGLSNDFAKFHAICDQLDGKEG
jgi:hypothetical protein